MSGYGLWQVDKTKTFMSFVLRLNWINPAEGFVFNCLGGVLSALLPKYDWGRTDF